MGEWESGRVGEWESGRGGEWENYPISNAQFAIPLTFIRYIRYIRYIRSESVAELPSRIKFQKELEFACEF